MAPPIIMLSFVSLIISSTVAEPPRCHFNGLIYYGCDLGRCCSIWNYCSSDPYFCGSGSGYCKFQCFQSANNNQIGGIINICDIVVNATYNVYYNDDDVVSRGLAASLSCGSTSLLNDTSSYHSAAFGRRRRHDNNAAASTCGQCLKLRNLKSGTEATVRIVHELTTEGLELNNSTFYKLSSKTRDHDDHLVLNYNLTTCHQD